MTTVQLAKVAASLSLDYAALLNGRKVQRPVPSVFLKHAANQDFDERDASALDKALDQGRALAGLRSMLGDVPLALQASTFSQREATADTAEAPARDGYRLARDVRRWLGMVDGQLADLRALIEERFGVAVLVRRLEASRVTAVGLRAGDAGAIVLNSRDHKRASNPLLARVYLAHELCHLLFDPSPGGVHIVLDLDVDRKSQVAEQRARGFAAEFLLPQDGLLKLLGPASKVYDFAAAPEMVRRARSAFGTPHEITANHLCNREFIDGRLRDWLEEVRTPFDGTPPATSLPPADGASTLVVEGVRRAHREGLVTDSEARQTLGVDPLSPLPWEEETL